MSAEPISLAGSGGFAETERAYRKRSVVLIVGVVIVGAYVLTAATGWAWLPHGITDVVGPPFAGASWGHPFGTDYLGRDMFSRVIAATRTDLVLAVGGTLISAIIGILVGLTSAHVGGVADDVLMRIVEGLISLPAIMLGLLVISAVGVNAAGNAWLLVGVLVVIYAPRIARISRSIGMNIEAMDYVTAAKLRGERSLGIIWRDVAPNCVPILLVEITIRLGSAPAVVGALGFLGFGIQPPSPEWGLMISENRSAIFTDAISVLAPAAVLAFFIIGVNMLGEGLAARYGLSADRR
jgi:peptide/nickel transport system permease protein